MDLHRLLLVYASHDVTEAYLNNSIYPGIGVAFNVLVYGNYGILLENSSVNRLNLTAP